MKRFGTFWPHGGSRWRPAYPLDDADTIVDYKCVLHYSRKFILT